MSKSLAQFRRDVIRRADNRCEYCRLAQEGQAAAFHLDHIQPQARGGPTVLENLALACVSCSLRKRDKQEVLDQISGEMVPLFHPRRDRWSDHFEWTGVVL